MKKALALLILVNLISCSNPLDRWGSRCVYLPVHKQFFKIVGYELGHYLVLDVDPISSLIGSPHYVDELDLSTARPVSCLVLLGTL